MNRGARAFALVALFCAAQHPLGCTPLEPGTDTFGANGGASVSGSSGASGATSTGGSGGTLGGSTSGGGSDAGGTGAEPSGGASQGGGDQGGAGDGGEAGCPPDAQRDLVRVPEAPGELEITENTAWSCAHDYVLNGAIVVAPDATLTIEAGTKIRATTGAMLLSMRRARLEILGSADAPVVFTSDEPEGQRSPGDWRGIVLIGDAPSHAANVQVYNTLGDHRADYGGGPGGSALGSCGIVRYTRIEFAGGNLDEVATPGAALTLAGCGSRTDVHHVQVHRPTDGIGILGGTANLTHLLVSGSARGDAIEWSGGFTGTLQFLIAQSLGGAVGMLGSNSEADPERVPVSAPRVFNATLVGTQPLVLGSHYGFLLQFGSFATLKNSVVYGFADAAFDLRLPSDVLANGLGPGLSVDVSHVLMHENATQYSSEASGLAAMASMRVADPGLEAALTRIAPSFLPTADEVLIEPAEAMAPFDTTATYRGAISPDGPDWTSGWTAFPER